MLLDQSKYNFVNTRQPCWFNYTLQRK